MKLTTTAQVSVDGVMQGPGGPQEDERGVFERGGWAHFDDEASTVMDEIYQRADAFLFGRRTYEVFAGSWGAWPDPGDSPIWTALHERPKYVASTTLTEPRWATTSVVVGQGTRLFPDTGRNIALDLADSRSTPSGVTIQVYRTTGHRQFGTATGE
jgi:dihydrofolate reductase